jgi:hypothetical protein
MIIDQVIIDKYNNGEISVDEYWDVIMRDLD